MSETSAESAALAVVAVLTEKVLPGAVDGAKVQFVDQQPEDVISFLLSTLIVTIQNLCGFMEVDPSDYVRQMALSVSREVYNSQ